MELSEKIAGLAQFDLIMRVRMANVIDRVQQKEIPLKMLGSLPEFNI